MQTIVWLGTVINSADFTVAASEKRIKSLWQDLVDVLFSSVRLVHVKRIVGPSYR